MISDQKFVHDTHFMKTQKICMNLKYAYQMSQGEKIEAIGNTLQWDEITSERAFSFLNQSVFTRCFRNFRPNSL